MRQTVALFCSVSLLLLNAFFVAAEFALVRVRATRLEELRRQGNRKAGAIQIAVKELDAYLSATQLGVTFASLGLGWIGEPAFAWLLEVPLAAFGIHSQATVENIALVTAFATITSLHIIVGELVPKSLAIQYPESVGLWVGVPLRMFYHATYPLLWLVNHATRLVLRALRIRPVPVSGRSHSEAELRIILSEAHRSGTISEAKRQLLEHIFDYSARTARQIMIPRGDIVPLRLDRPWEENMAVIRRTEHTRYPLCMKDVDDVVGMVHVKDLFHNRERLQTSQDLKSIKRDMLFVPGTRRVDLLQRDFQQRHMHMAIVIDEYGATAGLVTLEDVIEELVGDIQDEFDRERPPIVEIPDGYLIDGMMLTTDAASTLGADFEPLGAVSTLGGYVTSKLGRIPRVGDATRLQQFEIRVVEMKGRRVTRLLATRVPADAE